METTMESKSIYVKNYYHMFIEDTGCFQHDHTALTVLILLSFLIFVKVTSQCCAWSVWSLLTTLRHFTWFFTWYGRTRRKTPDLNVALYYCITSRRE